MEQHYVTLFRTIWDRLNSHESLDLAAQVSFYFVLSLFPFLIVLASLLGWLPTTTRWDSFSDWLTTYFPQQRKTPCWRRCWNCRAAMQGSCRSDYWQPFGAPGPGL